jgi:hypothetical protein
MTMIKKWLYEIKGWKNMTLKEWIFELRTVAKYLFIDIMRDTLWPLYHKYILHKGRYGTREWLVGCGHLNPFYILTPKLLKEQIKASKNWNL